MITLKIVLDKRRAKRDNTFPLVFRMNYNHQVRDIPTGYSILETDWDGKTHSLKKSCIDYDEVSMRLRDCHVKYLGKVIEFERMNSGHVNIQELKEFVISKRIGKLQVGEFWLQEIESLKKNNRHGGARVHQQAYEVLNKVKCLDVPFEKLDYNFLKQMETILIGRGTKQNSVGVYYRALRSIYNQAINSGEVEFCYYPFKKYKIKKEATLPHPISKEEMQKYFMLNLEPTSYLHDSWLLGKLIFLLGGINVADLFRLTDDNLKSGRLIYFRSKTKKMYSLNILPEAQEIFRHLKQKGTRTLCGVLNDDDLNDKSRLPYIIQQKNHLMNDHLKKIGAMIGCSENMSGYTFRYTIANLCKQMGYDVQLIAELLGHSYGNKVTGIYLEAYDLKLIDEMNRRVCSTVQGYTDHQPIDTSSTSPLV
ncbi:MAG: site-specific integrase [Bacteroidetes bacterium]|nr:site-specific integrase [Bacteroidota bacterium]